MGKKAPQTARERCTVVFDLLAVFGPRAAVVVDSAGRPERVARLNDIKEDHVPESEDERRALELISSRRRSQR